MPNETQQLGRLERVPLREYWEREDTNFTPWLARDENIALLAEAIGMERFATTFRRRAVGYLSRLKETTEPILPMTPGPQDMTK